MRFWKWISMCVALGIFGLSLGLGLNFDKLGLPKGGDLPLVGKLIGTRAQAQPLPTADKVPVHPVAPRGSARHTIIVDVAQSVSPAVVSIGVTKTSYRRQYDALSGDLFFSIAQRKQNFPYLGSGFIIDKQGHVITNYHVVEDSSSISVTLTDRRTYNARLLDADRYVDIALLKIDKLDPGADLPTIRLGNSHDIMIGETVLAIGNPFGPLIADPRPSVSVGVVSAVNRSFKSDLQGRIYQDMIQTDAAINPGNSGGPLVNLDGEVIGINSFIFSQSGDSSSVGFSIPISRAAKIAEEIIKFGKLRAIHIDFDVLSLTPYIIQTLDLATDQTGALVRAIDSGGPAQQAGIEPGDVIIKADEKDIQDSTDLMSYFLTRTVGETVRLRILRQRSALELSYQIHEGSSSK